MEKKIFINDLETQYSIDEMGRVKNLETGKYLKGSYTRQGYHYIRISVNGIKYRFYTHRKVAEYFVEGYQEDFVVNHKDGNKQNNAASNLEWISQSENVQHAHNNNLIKKSREIEYYTGDLPNEQWVELEEYPDYHFSSLGRIVSTKKSRPVVLKPSIVNGYYKVTLCNNGVVKGFLVHSIIYKAFTKEDIDTSIYCIDHIDNNPFNNNISNLRKVTRSENVQYGIREQDAYSKLRKVQCFKDDVLIGEYDSCHQAAKELGLDSSSISKVCRGIYSHTHNYVFKYKD